MLPPTGNKAPLAGLRIHEGDAIGTTDDQAAAVGEPHGPQPAPAGNIARNARELLRGRRIHTDVAVDPSASMTADDAPGRETRRRAGTARSG